MNNLTAESIISTLADAGQPMPSRAIANALGAEHIGKVRALLTELVHDETVERAKGGKYQLRDAMVHEAWPRGSSCGRETLPTDKVAIKARKKRKEKAKVLSEKYGDSMNVTPEEIGVEIPNNCVTPAAVVVEVMTLEKAERAVDEHRARDQRIRDAVQRLKCKANFKVDPVDNLEFKIEILDGLGSADADLWEVLKDVITDLRRLNELSLGPF